MFVFSSLSLRILYFGQRSFCKYFLSVYGLSSHSLDSVFSEQTLLILIRFSLSIIFFFYGLCLGAVFKKVIAIPMIIQIFSRYFLGYLQFCIVHLSLWSFRDNFCEGCMICIQTYFFFACGCSVVPGTFVERIIFPSLYRLCSFIKHLLTIFTKGYFWVLYSVSLIQLPFLVFFFWPIPHKFAYCSFTVSLGVQQRRSSDFVIPQYRVGCS